MSSSGTPGSKKPSDSAFKQQQLPAWQPILSPPYVIGTLVVVGLVFIPIGIALLVASANVVEVRTRYDEQCASERSSLGKDWHQCDVITVNLNVKEKMSKPVYMYYEIENFYQNHRRYVQSRDDLQLRGEKRDFDSIDDCSPFRSVGDRRDHPEKSFSSVFAPCGLIAWSQFNDSFILKDPVGAIICDTSSGGDCKSDGVAWDSDKDVKFKDANSAYSYSYDVPYPTEVNHTLPNQKSEDFMVWMRTAAFPHFRKLFRIITRNLDPGSHSVKITDRFPIDKFEGRKYVVLSTTEWVGGKNSFLGICYIVVGGISLFLGLVFLVMQIVKPRKLADMKRILDDQEATTSASSSLH